MKRPLSAPLLGLAGCMALVVYVTIQNAMRDPSPPRESPASPDVRVVPPQLLKPGGEATTAPAAPAPSEAAEERPSPEAFFQELARLHATDKPRALELARRGEAWFPKVGKLAEARKAMIVTLLVDIGNMSEARSLARLFISSFPESAYRPLVQGATGVHPRPGAPANVSN